MQINQVAKAGTLESNDALVMVMPNDGPGIELELESIVIKQFGAQIRAVVLEAVEAMGISQVRIKVQDKGALDYTLRARVQTALKRAMEVGADQ